MCCLSFPVSRRKYLDGSHRILHSIRSLPKEGTPPLLTVVNAFRAYGIASQYHLKEEVRLAARLLPERPMDFYACTEGLCLISGADLLRLWRYRTKCSTLARDRINVTIGKDNAPSASKCCSGSVDVVTLESTKLRIS
jgi:hypothetical protein